MRWQPTETTTDPPLSCAYHTSPTSAPASHLRGNAQRMLSFPHPRFGDLYCNRPNQASSLFSLVLGWLYIRYQYQFQHGSMLRNPKEPDLAGSSHRIMSAYLNYCAHS